MNSHVICIISCGFVTQIKWCYASAVNCQLIYWLKHHTYIKVFFFNISAFFFFYQYHTWEIHQDTWSTYGKVLWEIIKARGQKSQPTEKVWESPFVVGIKPFASLIGVQPCWWDSLCLITSINPLQTPKLLDLLCPLKLDTWKLRQQKKPGDPDRRAHLRWERSPAVRFRWGWV